MQVTKLIPMQATRIFFVQQFFSKNGIGCSAPLPRVEGSNLGKNIVGFTAHRGGVIIAQDLGLKLVANDPQPINMHLHLLSQPICVLAQFAAFRAGAGAFAKR